MNTLEIDHVLKTHPSTSNVFKGVYARNRNGISFVLIHFSGTGVESHITSDVSIVVEVGL
jgi:hypothetical protein